jgi:hypothetical protein
MPTQLPGECIRSDGDGYGFEKFRDEEGVVQDARIQTDLFSARKLSWTQNTSPSDGKHVSR